jgi:VIT1/CCC1 family predicted Fe2+/Mn2+ transporter
MSDKDYSDDEGVSELPREIELSITRADLDRVARVLGLSDGRVLYAMLVGPGTMASIDDYERCVVHCSNLFDGDALVACIEGCATVSSSFTASTTGTAT